MSQKILNDSPTNFPPSSYLYSAKTQKGCILWFPSGSRETAVTKFALPKFKENQKTCRPKWRGCLEVIKLSLFDLVLYDAKKMDTNM